MLQLAKQYKIHRIRWQSKWRRKSALFNGQLPQAKKNNVRNAVQSTIAKVIDPWRSNVPTLSVENLNSMAEHKFKEVQQITEEDKKPEEERKMTDDKLLTENDKSDTVVSKR